MPALFGTPRASRSAVVSAKLVLNLQCPEIREWCPSCHRYEQHANGAVQVPAPFGTVEALTWVSATQCLYCSWVTLYR